ncbi:hypothetical protein JW926_18325 [Candidatus Sumerlaeota bacterium]|nr:hypothetical protein [Candidatus Sumerlaeota bacterium]
MIDPDIERRYADCKELLDLWHRFHGYFGLAIKGDLKLITHEREAEFLNLKSRIAMLHDSFMESLKHDAEIGQHILTIIERSITLKHLSKVSLAEVKKMEIEWHESYLLLSETVASIEEKRQVLANVNPTKYKIDRFKSALTLNLKAFVGGIFFKLLLIVIAIPIILVVVHKFIWSFDNLRRINATRDLYYSTCNLYRKILSPGMPYDRFEDISRNASERPGDLELESNSTYTKEKAVPMFRNAGIDGVLSDNKVAFKNETFKIKKQYDKLEILMFMIKTDDGTEKAENCVSDFYKWLDTLPPEAKNMISSRFDVFNKNNVFIALDCPKESVRKAVKELEFGVEE